MKSAYSVGEVMRITGAGRKTVGKWFDGGLIAGYRLPDHKEGRGDRRYCGKSLLAFMRRQGMPTAHVTPDPPGVLFAGVPGRFAAEVRRLLKGFTTRSEQKPLFVGLALREHPPAVVVVNAGWFDAATTREICETAGCVVVVLLPEDASDPAPWEERGWVGLAADAGPEDVAGAVRMGVRR